MPDHFHILVGLQPTMAVSQLVAAVKASSSGFINDNRWVLGRFDWQEGFGAFSYSHSQVPTVARYIERQEQHHSRKTFQEEYLKLLNRFGVAHDQRYIFRPIE